MTALSKQRIKTAGRNGYALRRILAAVLTGIALSLQLLISASTSATETPPAERNSNLLADNRCLQQLDDVDPVIVSAAFHEGTGGYRQLVELIERKPWSAVSASMQQQLDQLLATRSPFLIVQMNKRQALALDRHRDLIKWALVQSTDKPCG